MSSLDLDFDTKMNSLEAEWRQAYEAGLAAQAEYRSLSASAVSNVRLLKMARERLDRAETSKARIMAKIERLEEIIQGED